LIVATHSAERLALVLDGAARQSEPPTTVNVAVDGDDPRIAAHCRRFAAETGCRIHLTQRASHGVMRLAQTRNNAVRTLRALGYAKGLLLFIDGDIVLADDCVRLHRRLHRHGHLTIGERVNLTPAQTAALTDDGRLPSELAIAPELARLRRIHIRTTRNVWLRRLHLARAHKPNIIGAHFAVDLATYERVNGFDEGFQGYGGEDEDFARRLYAAGTRPLNAVLRTRVYHLHHPTRSTGRPRDNPGSIRFRTTPWTPFCHAGLHNPVAQHPCRVTVS
jgi:hypothetical protein